MSSFGNQPQGAPQAQPSGQEPYGPPYGQQHGQPQWAPAYVQPGRQEFQPNYQPYQPAGQEPYRPPFGLSTAEDARRHARSSAVRQMVIGAVLALIGIVLTVVTYSAASGGGHYVVAYGPAIVGLITFVKGLVGYLRT